jgi:5'-3' exonuclease
LVNIVNPQKLLYIAVDGVAPCAKIKQQRMRRYKSIKYRNQVNALKKKHGIKVDNNWDNAAITPGTLFMSKITERLLKIMDKFDKKIEVIFSSANTHGEGEHKILQYINANYVASEKSIIYGLDADLIFLALASKKENIYLMREVQHFGQNAINNLQESVEFNYVSIDKLKNSLYNEIINKLDIKNELNVVNIVSDFIVIGYFMGNDFIPHIPSINIKTGGLDLLLKAYISTLNNLNNFDNNLENNYCYLIDNNSKINEHFMCHFLNYLSSHENDYFVNQYRTNQRNKNMNRQKTCESDDPFQIEKFKLDNLQFHIKDPIKLGKDSSELWKPRYYRHYFDNDNPELIDDICANYLTGIMWITKYYLNKCCSWSWYYKYDHAPMMSDLSAYFSRNIKYYDALRINKGKKIEPFIQLLTVLHPTCNYLLPQPLRYLMKDPKSPIIDLYPHKFDEDLIGNDVLWKCIPILPKLDISRIKQHISYNKINANDMKRNERHDIYIRNSV